jgi:hypothetical protein
MLRESLLSRCGATGQLLTAGSQSFAPDAAGNLASAKSANRFDSCTYDQAGNLTYDGTPPYTR